MPEETRISISEDKLYRALGELELRLVKGITEALDKKAEQIQVDNHETRIGELEKSRVERAHMEGDVSKHELRITDLERESVGNKAVRRAFKFAVGSGIVGVVAVLTDVFLIIHYIQHP